MSEAKNFWKVALIVALSSSILQSIRKTVISFGIDLALNFVFVLVVMGLIGYLIDLIIRLLTKKNFEQRGFAKIAVVVGIVILFFDLIEFLKGII